MPVGVCFVAAPADAASQDVFFSDESGCEDEEPGLYEFKATAIPANRSSQGAARCVYRGVSCSRSPPCATRCAPGVAARLLAENAGCADARCLPQTRRHRRARAWRVRASGAWRRARTMMPHAAGLAPRRQGPQAYLAGRERALANAVTRPGAGPFRGRAAESARAWQAQQALRTACSQMRPRRQRGAWTRTRGSRTRAGEWGTWWFL